MRKAPLTKSLFACPNCLAVYVASQEQRPGFGSFDCWDCNKEIFVWSGNYHFTNWDQIDPTCDIQWEACKNISWGGYREPA